MEVRVIENSWLARLGAWKLRTGNVALTLGHTIHLYHISRDDFLKDRQWVCHEIIHVYQYRKYGLVPFLLMYLWESARKGYRGNKWEAAARAGANDIALLENIIFV